MSNNFANFFNSFQAQQGAHNVPQQQQQQQQQQQSGQPNPFPGQNGSSLPPNINPDLLRAMMQQWQAGQQNNVMQQQQQQQQQQHQQEFLSGVPAGARPGNGMGAPGQNGMMGQGGMQQGVGAVGSAGNFSNMQQGGAISGAQAAALASQAAALTRQKQIQQQNNSSQAQASTLSGQANGLGGEGNGNMVPQNLQQAFEMARSGTLSASQANQLRAFIESHRQSAQLNPQAGASVLQQQQQQQAQHRGQVPLPQQQPNAMIHQQQRGPNTLGQQQQSGAPSIRPPGPASGPSPMQVYKALQGKVAELESRLEGVNGDQRAALDVQLSEARRMLETMTMKIAQHMQQQQQMQQQQSQNQASQAAIRPPNPQQQQQQTSQPQPRPSPRPGNANTFGTPNFQQQQQFATLNQSPHLGPGASLTQQPLAPGQQMVRPSNMVGLMNLKPEQFMRALNDVMSKRGQPITSTPIINNQRLDLFRFYQVVQAHGGSEAVSRKGMWAGIVAALELAPSTSPKCYQLAHDIELAFRSYLSPFEEVWQKATQHQYQMAQAQANQRQLLQQQQQQQQQQQLAQQQRPPAQQQQRPPPGLQQSQFPAIRPASQQQGDAQRPPPPSAPTFNFNGRPISFPPAPTLPSEKLAAMGQTQEQFANAFKNQQMAHFQQQIKFAQQQQQQQALQGNQAAVAQQSGQLPQFQQPFMNSAQQQPMMPGLQQAQFSGFPGQSAPQQPQQLQPQQSAVPPPHVQQQDFNTYGQNQAAGPSSFRPPQGASNDGLSPEPKLIPVSEKQLEEARAVMARIDEELSRTRPRLTVNTTMPEAEREEVLNEVSKLTWVLDTVNALLPVFYAMQNHLEPAKRLKIMAYMFRDQLDLLPSRQCILRKADLDKLKMQMSRCIHYVRTSNPTISNFIIEEYKKETGAKRAQAMLQMQQQQQQMQHLQQQQQQQQQAALQQSSGVDDAMTLHGIKRGLRVEDLKPPPIKKGRVGAGLGSQVPQRTSSMDAPPYQSSSPLLTGASPPAGGAKGKRGVVKPKGKKTTAGGAAPTTPALPSTPAQGPGKAKSKSSLDSFNDSKAVMADAGDEGKDDSGEASTAKVEAEVQELASEAERAMKDPAAFAEASWQEMFTMDGSQGVEAMGAVDEADGKSLESILSMLGQTNGANGIQEQAFQSSAADLQPSALEQADGQVDIDLLDFIDAEAMAPDSTLEDPQAELEQLLAASSSSIPANTPELVDSSRASSSTTSSSLNKKLNTMGFEMAGTPWSTTSPSGGGANLSSEDEEGPSKGEIIRDALSRLTGVPANDDATTTANGVSSGAEPQRGTRVKGLNGGNEPSDWWDQVHQDEQQSQPWAILS